MRLLICLVLFACPLSALAAYKCETVQPGSRARVVSYGDTPCRDGQSTTVETDFNTAAPQAESADPRLAQQKAELHRLERLRHRREARDELKAQKIARIHAARQQKCARLAQRQKWREEDAFMAAGKAADRARLKARRSAEAYRLECG